MISFKKLFFIFCICFSSFIFSMKQDANKLIFCELPEEIKLQVFDYIFIDYFLQGMELKDLQTILNLTLVNKSFKKIIACKHISFIKKIIKDRQFVAFARIIGDNNMSESEKILKVKDFLKSGFDLNSKNKDGNTVLIIACKECLKDLVTLLIDTYIQKHGKEKLKEYINIKNYYQNAAYSLVVSYKSFKSYTDIREILVDNGSEKHSLVSSKDIFWAPNY